MPVLYFHASSHGCGDARGRAPSGTVPNAWRTTAPAYARCVVATGVAWGLTVDTRRIKVLVLLDTFVWGGGGAERLAIAIATHLPADRYEV